VRQNLHKLLSQSTESPSVLSSPPLLSGALSMALAHANMQKLLAAPTASLGDSTEDKPSVPGAADLDAHTSAHRSTLSSVSLTTRILVMSVSEADLSSQYVGLMNAVFAAQRMSIPIDMLRIGSHKAAFLQQASDATNGVFLSYDPATTDASITNGHEEDQDMDSGDSPKHTAAAMGLLQTLMMGYLPDVTARRNLLMPGSEEVDFRPACFCHGKIVEEGGVCSVCLSSKLYFGVVTSLIRPSFLSPSTIRRQPVSDMPIELENSKESLHKTSSIAKEKEEEEKTRRWLEWNGYA
jgi:transcription initiation factor TFIIH subunit 3